MLPGVPELRRVDWLCILGMVSRRCLLMKNNSIGNTWIFLQVLFRVFDTACEVLEQTTALDRCSSGPQGTE